MAYLNNPATQDALGIDDGHRTYAAENASVVRPFEANADRYAFRAEDSIGALLERGVRVLVYAGVDDFVCNWVREVAFAATDHGADGTEATRSETSAWCSGWSGPRRTCLGMLPSTSGTLRERWPGRCAAVGA